VRLLSWNVNGLRSALRKGGARLLSSREYSVVLLQEVRVDSVPDVLVGTHAYLNPAEQRGYSGVLSISRPEPESVVHGIGDRRFDREGRVTTLEFPGFFVVNAYFVNAQRGLSRLGEKLDFDRAIGRWTRRLRESKPVVVGGDFNVAHEDRDIARPESNRGSAGFTPRERRWFSAFLASGFVDSLRLFVAGGGHYTWWTYRYSARARNIGWRIDYFVVSSELRSRVRRAAILDQIRGSDHAPIELDIAEPGRARPRSAPR
jgi:exodeoxyribonuclease III